MNYSTCSSYSSYISFMDSSAVTHLHLQINEYAHEINGGDTPYKNTSNITLKIACNLKGASYVQRRIAARNIARSVTEIEL